MERAVQDPKRSSLANLANRHRPRSLKNPIPSPFSPVDLGGLKGESPLTQAPLETNGHKGCRKCVFPERARWTLSFAPNPELKLLVERRAAWKARASRTRKLVQLGTIRLGRKYEITNMGLRFHPPRTILSPRRVRSGVLSLEDGRPKATATQESRELLENSPRGQRAVRYVKIQPRQTNDEA